MKSQIKNKQPSSAKNYVFTINNYTLEDIDTLSRFYTEHCGYLTYGKEVGESGTPHLQGYFQLKSKNRITWLKSHLHPTAWFAVSLGTDTEAADYCKKDGDVTELGIRVISGQRRGLAAVIDMVRKGCTMAELVAEHPDEYFQYTKSIKTLVSDLAPKRDHKTKIVWLYGPTGTGKSRYCAAVSSNAYNKNGGHKWWDGYNGISDVIIDDYRPDFCKFSELLRLFDRYSFQAETKGGTIELSPGTIYVTAPKAPTEIWSQRTEEDLLQLARRVEDIIHVSSLDDFLYIKKDGERLAFPLKLTPPWKCVTDSKSEVGVNITPDLGPNLGLDLP